MEHLKRLDWTPARRWMASGDTFAGMGVDFADYNNDGWPDIIVTDLANQRYALYHNDKDGTFDYCEQLRRARRDHSAAFRLGGAFLGLRQRRLEGSVDRAIARHGHHRDQRAQLALSRAPIAVAKSTREEICRRFGSLRETYSTKHGLREPWRLATLITTEALDAMVSSNDGPAWVLLNETEITNHWVTLNLVGVKSNRDAIGAQVRLLTSAGEQYSTVTTTGSYQSSSDKRLHFGLGNADSIREIEIRWPSGIRQMLTNQRADTILTITESIENSSKVSH